MISYIVRSMVTGIQGVIFDLDGTLTVPYLQFAAMKARANIGDVDLLEYLDAAEPDEKARLQSLLVAFEDDGVANAELNPGARETLAFLADRRIPVGLLTRNSRRSVDGICRKFQLAFDQVITREDAPYKPSPAPVHQIAREWDLPPAELLLVGDYKWDLLCARNAGTRSAVLINGQYKTTPDWATEADYLIRCLDEIPQIVDDPSVAGRGGGGNHRPAEVA